MSNRFDEDRVKLVREDYNLPSTKDGIVELVRNIIDGGAIHKIVIELGKPVFAYRMAPLTYCEEGDLDLEAAMNNAYVDEYLNSEPSPPEVLFDMMQLVHAKKLLPLCFVTGYTTSTPVLDMWLDLEGKGLPASEGVETIFGVPVEIVGFLPPETLLLCGAPYVEAEYRDISYVVKATMEIGDGRNQADSEADAGIGSDPEGRSQPDDRVEAAPGGGVGSGWVPQGLVGQRP